MSALTPVTRADAGSSPRVANIDQLPFGDTLLSVAGILGGSAHVDQRQAQARLAQLLDDGSVAFDAVSQRALDRAALAATAALCADAQLLARCIDAIDEPEVLCQLAVHAGASRVRQAAAQAIVEPSQLRRVLKESGGKDKNVHKIVKHKLDEFNALEKAAADVQASIAAVCAALERHVYQPFDALFVPTFEHLQSQWTGLAAHATDDVVVAATRALARCREVIERHAKQAAEHAAEESARANADADRQRIVEQLQQNLTAQYEGSAPPVGWQALGEQWNRIAQYKSPTLDEQTRYTELRQANERLAALLARHGGVRDQTQALESGDVEQARPRARALKQSLEPARLLATEIEQVTAAQAVLAAYEKTRAERLATQARIERQVGGLLHKALAAVGAGHIREAAGLRRAAESKLALLKTPPPSFAAQLQQLENKLSELKDWRSYAVAPKRAQLIERMQALVGAEIEPPQLAQHIKKLQDEWKSINKGVEQSNDDWQRFQTAAHQAFEPCRDYFATQAKRRAENLDKRRALLERLERFVAEHDWQAPDWREVSKAAHESAQLWRRHQPVDRGPSKPLQSRFDALLADLQARLAVEYDRVATEKRRLIARAQHIATQTDTRAAIDAIKQLQATWQSLGSVARDVEQQLWQEFRQHCDAVFNKRREQHSEQQASLRGELDKAIDLCEQVERVATLSGPELLAATKQLSALREAFDALGELPKPKQRDVQTRFLRALRQCDQALARERASAQEQAWSNVLTAGDKIRAWRLSVAERAADATQTALKQEAQAYIDAATAWPKGVLPAMKQELNQARATDVADNEKALRLLCVRAEIVSDTPTPSDDQTLRRTYQLQQLTQGLGQERDDFDKLILAWIAVGPTPADLHSALLARFNACRAKASRR